MKKIAVFLTATCILAAAISGALGNSLLWLPIFSTISTPGIMFSQPNTSDKTAGKMALALGSFLVCLISHALFFGLGRGISLAFNTP